MKSDTHRHYQQVSRTPIILERGEVDAMAKSSVSRRSHKRKSSLHDAKPYPEFPLTAHPSGRLCKKHGSKQYYFGPLIDKRKINGRKGLGFCTLRYCFDTVAGESKYQVAVNAIMGHVDDSMAGVYRERISDERLRAVTETVRGWLWAGSQIG
jgi:integrase